MLPPRLRHRPMKPAAPRPAAGPLIIGRKETQLIVTLVSRDRRGDGLPNESWQRALVVLNSSDEGATEVTLPPGEWTVALDEGGAARRVSGKMAVRYKSGVVLYQR